MKFTNTKKIASSALAILLCASMILSFSLSVYAAVDSSHLYVDNGSSITCVATVYTITLSRSEVEAATHPSVNVQNVEYAQVSLYADDGSGESYENDTMTFSINGASTEAAVVTVECDNFVSSASAYHVMGDIYGNEGYADTHIVP